MIKGAPIAEINRRDITLSLPQLDVYNARTPLILDMAGQGSGKTENIGVQTIEMIQVAPQIKGFIAANTYIQLSQSTLTKAFETWRKYKGWTEFDKDNREGNYVTDRKPPPHFKKYHKLKSYNNTISFDNGCLIFTGSLDNYKAHDGKEFGWAHLDETKDTAKEALTHVILARLRQTGLYYAPDRTIVYCENEQEAAALNYTPFNPCYIHTSPAYGGVAWLIEMFKLSEGERPLEIKNTLLNKEDYYLLQEDNITAVIYQTFHNAANLPAGWIENQIKMKTSEETLLFIYGYPFGRTGNEYYNEFNMQKHVVPTIPVDFNSRLYLTFDFNVMPYVTEVALQVDNIVRYYNKETGEKIDFIEPHHVGFKALNVMRFKVVKEFCYPPPNNVTEKVSEAAAQWYTMNGGSQDVRVYGDAEGHTRIRGLPTLTQYKIIKRIIQKFVACEIAAKRSNIGVEMRRKLINKILANVFPEIEFYVSAECVETVRDFEFLKQAPEGGKFKEKVKDPVTGGMYEKIGHVSDAIEYMVCEILKSYLKYID